MKTLIATCTLALAAGGALAQTSPVGLWKTIDDDGKTEKSLVRIIETGGVLSGRIEKIFDASKQTALCDECSDERKGKPVLGMQILRNLRTGDDKSVWEGGDILDPNNGKIYRSRLKPVDGGRKLEMRGYIGPFFRTQTWIRVE